MTTDEMRIAIAEACPSIAEIDEDNGGTFWKRPDPFVIFDPLNDLNAMHEVENKLQPDEFPEYLRRLQVITQSEHCFDVENRFFICHATAPERAEAFLKVKGLWRE